MVARVQETRSSHYLMLRAESARDLMTPNPLSVSFDSYVTDAANFLMDQMITAAPVIDGAGRPVGVLSRSDIVRSLDPNRLRISRPEFYERVTLQLPDGTLVEDQDPTSTERKVCDVMTPVVYAVTADTPAFRVVEQMLARSIHRLFVVDSSGTLIGVISTFDILNHLDD